MSIGVKRSGVNVKKTKMIISTKNAGKVTIEGGFLALLAEKV